MFRNLFFFSLTLAYFSHAIAADRDILLTASYVQYGGNAGRTKLDNILQQFDDAKRLGEEGKREYPCIMEFIINKDVEDWNALVIGAFANQRVSAKDLWFVIQQNENPTGILAEDKNNEHLFNYVIQQRLTDGRYADNLIALLLTPAIDYTRKSRLNVSTAKEKHSPFTHAIENKYHASLKLILDAWPLGNDALAATFAVEERKYISSIWSDLSPKADYSVLQWLMRNDGSTFTYLKDYVKVRYVTAASHLINFYSRKADRSPRTTPISVLTLAGILADQGSVDDEVLAKLARNTIGVAPADKSVIEGFNQNTRSIIKTNLERQ